MRMQEREILMSAGRRDLVQLLSTFAATRQFHPLQLSPAARELTARLVERLFIVSVVMFGVGDYTEDL